MKPLFSLLAALLLGGSAAAATPQWLRYPAISPDGTQVAFSYKGDLWIVDASGGAARQLTSHSAHDYAPVWSPDSKQLVFASDRHGNFDLYRVAAHGGEPQRLTTHSAKETPWTFTPDGQEILFTAAIQDPASSVLIIF